MSYKHIEFQIRIGVTIIMFQSISGHCDAWKRIWHDGRLLARTEINTGALLKLVGDIDWQISSCQYAPGHGRALNVTYAQIRYIERAFNGCLYDLLQQDYNYIEERGIVIYRYDGVYGQTDYTIVMSYQSGELELKYRFLY